MAGISSSSYGNRPDAREGSGADRVPPPPPRSLTSVSSLGNESVGSHHSLASDGSRSRDSIHGLSSGLGTDNDSDRKSRSSRSSGSTKGGESMSKQGGNLPTGDDFFASFDS